MEVKARNANNRSPSPVQDENAVNGCNRSVTPPQDALPPTKFGTLFRPRRTPKERRPNFTDLSKTPKEKTVEFAKASYETPTIKEEKEMVFSGDTLLNVPEGDLNSSAWAMMGDSENFDWQGFAETDEEAMALMNESITSPLKTPSNANVNKNDTEDNSPPICENSETKRSNRLVGSARAKKKESSTVEVPGKSSPFDIFRQNSTHIALDETSAYAAKIKELERALAAETARRKELEAKSASQFQTPSTLRSLQSLTPSSVASNTLDADSLYARNQTLVKEVRFAEQTCIEVSDKNQTLEKKAAALQAELDTLRKEHQTLQLRVTSLDRERTTAESLENSWKSRVAEMEGMLKAAQEEKSEALEKCVEWETRYNETVQQAASQTDEASEREGKLIRAILHQESLSKDLKEARQKLKSAEAKLVQANAVERDLQDRLQSQQERAQSKMESLRREIDLLKASRNDQEMQTSVLLQQEKDQLIDQLQNASQEIQQHISTISELRATVAALTVNLEEEKTRRIEITKNLEEEQEQLAKVKKESESLHQSIEESLHEKGALEAELNATKRLLDEANNRFEEALSEAKVLRQTVEQLESQQTEASDCSTNSKEDHYHQTSVIELQNDSVSPARTVNLELMEEARQDNNEPIQEMIVESQMCSDSNVSESLSSIAGISHLFADEESNAIPRTLSPPKNKGSQEQRSISQDLDDDDDEFVVETKAPNFEDTVSTLSMKLRETELERDLLKHTLKHSQLPAGQVDESDQAPVDRLRLELSSLNQTIESMTVELKNARDECTSLKALCEDKDERIHNLECRLQIAEQSSSRLDQLEVRLSKLSQENSMLVQKLEKASFELEKTKEKCVSLSLGNSTLDKQVVQLRLGNEELSAALNETKQSLQSVENELEDTRNRLSQTQAERLELRSKLSEQDEIASEWKSKVESEKARQEIDAEKITCLSNANNELRLQTDRLEREMQLLANQLEGKQTALKHLQEQLDGLFKTNASLESEKSSLETQLQEEKQRFMSSSSNHDDTIVALKKSISEGIDAMETAEVRRQAAERLAEDSEKRLFQLQGEYKAVKSEVEEKDSTILSLKNDLNLALNKLKECRHTLESDRYHLNQAQKDLKRLDSVVSALEADNAALRSECEELRSDLEMAESEMSENELTKAKMFALLKELKSRDEEIFSLQKSIEAAEDDVRTNLASLEAERDSLLKGLESKEIQLSSANQKLAKLSDELEKVKSEKSDVSHLVEKCKKELTLAKDVETNFASLQKEVADYKEQLALKEKRLKDSLQIETELREGIQAITQEKAKLQVDCTDCRAEIDRLKDGMKSERDEFKKLLESYQSASHSGEKAREQLFDVQEKLKQREVELASRNMVEAGNEVVDEVTLLRQYLGESEGVRQQLELQLAEMEAALHHREVELSNCTERIHVLEKKCKGLRGYTRKVAKKCDDWEVYFERQNGLTS